MIWFEFDNSVMFVLRSYFIYIEHIKPHIMSTTSLLIL